MKAAASLLCAALGTALAAACCSPRPSTELRTAQRVADTVRELVTVLDTVAERVTVFDTVRERTTILLDAGGDTVRTDTEREHVSDRTRERASANLQTVASTSSHEEEREDLGRETVIEQPEQTPLKPFLYGMLAGIVATLAVSIFVKLRKR